MMRLKERELIDAQLAKRIAQTGAMGSRPEAFSEEKTAFRASLLPEGGELKATQAGMKSGAKIRLLTGDDLAVKPGDGIWTKGDFYIVETVNRWSAHLEILCGARA